VILDTSAIVGLMLAEPDAAELASRLGAAAEVGIGTPTLLESAIVLTGRTGREQRPALETFLRRVGAVEVAFTEVHWRVAHDAFLKFGKGRHKASLNFGDCCAYATARVAERPLLCQGDDFRKTDLALA
jgi:ribonuclease VapC